MAKEDHNATLDEERVSNPAQRLRFDWVRAAIGFVVGLTLLGCGFRVFIPELVDDEPSSPTPWWAGWVLACVAAVGGWLAGRPRKVRQRHA